jgi:YkoY family integral membrane protein
MDTMLMTLTTTNLLAVFFLVLIEGLLSFDNSIALAALVKKKLKNPKEQKKALLYGIWEAYFFRILVVFCGVWLMSFWQIKLVAGLYLIQLSIRELWPKQKKEKDLTGFSILSSLFGFQCMTPFWATVVSIEIMDIAFSIDSIGVALAISNIKWVLITGAILGILTMRLAANIFIDLIDKYPILEKTAFLLVGIAGIGVSLKAFHIEVPETPFMLILFGILLGSMCWNHIYPHAVERFLNKYYRK